MAELKRCKKCGKISSWNSYFNGYMCECGNIERKAKTNADCIRAMSDEELAEHIAGIIDDANSGSVIYSNRTEEWLEWLKQPAE